MQRLILFLIAVVLFGIAGFALIWFGTGRELQGPTIAFLTNCRDGEYQKAYDAAHPRFREAWSLEDLKRIWKHWRDQHGRFGEVVRRIGVTEVQGGDKDSRLELKLDLGFQDGHVIGRFFFLPDDDGVQKLAHASLTRRPDVDVPLTDRSRLKVTTRKLLELLDAGDAMGFYDALGAQAQWGFTPRALFRDVPKDRERLGAMKDIREGAGAEIPNIPVVMHERYVAYENGDKQYIAFSYSHVGGQWEVSWFERKPTSEMPSGR